jgi:UDP-2,3-diacylglucosamine hydrolase
MQDKHLSSASANKAQPETVALFISDLHLQGSLPQTTQAFFHFLQHHATNTRQLYLLGDVFEAWAGDDDIADTYNQQIVDAIRRVSDSGVEIFWMAGNRDFLASDGFAKAAGLTLLQDPFVAIIAGRRVVLTHGDAQCTDDAAYMAFRTQVRQPEWQQTFLAMPLAQRKSIIEGLRNGSREAQRGKSYEIMDVNADAIAALFETSATFLMIHGHTHRPACHMHQESGSTRIRHVLPDWDCDTDPPRGGWLAMNADGDLKRFDANGAEIR